MDQHHFLHKSVEDNIQPDKMDKYQLSLTKLHAASWTRSPAIAEGPRDAGVPVEIW